MTPGRLIPARLRQGWFASLLAAALALIWAGGPMSTGPAPAASAAASGLAGAQAPEQATTLQPAAKLQRPADLKAGADPDPALPRAAEAAATQGLSPARPRAQATAAAPARLHDRPQPRAPPLA